MKFLFGLGNDSGMEIPRSKIVDCESSNADEHDACNFNVTDVTEC